MFLQSCIGIHEDNALVFKVLLHAVINDFGFILRGYAGQKLLLGFGNPQLVEGFLNFGRNLFPCFPLLLRRSNIVLNIVKIQLIQISAPTRERHLFELFQGFQPEVQHPFRFFLNTGNFRDDFAGQAFPRLENRLVLIPEAIFILFQLRRLLSHAALPP
ncbi:hypothetical protein D1872_250750 [compost metagenome]